jgi:hypothetical protein
LEYAGRAATALSFRSRGFDHSSAALRLPPHSKHKKASAGWAEAFLIQNLILLD